MDGDGDGELDETSRAIEAGSPLQRSDGTGRDSARSDQSVSQQSRSIINNRHDSRNVQAVCTCSDCQW